MIALGALCLLLGAAPAQIQAQVPADTNPPLLAPVAAAAVSASPDDTVPPHRRRRTVDVSDWYARRLTIHRYVAFATLPVFAVQYAAGEQLFDKSRDAPTWAKTTHRVGATLLAGMFTVNTVTGLWNLWDARSVPEKRTLRTVHALTMLAADAGFTYAGVRLSDEAETSLQKRKEHRTLALSSMGLTLASALMMKIFNR
jgi:hypothetical protein